MSRRGDSAPFDNNEDGDEKEETAIARILQSSTCRRLFSWNSTGEHRNFPTELSEEAKQEQRLRWNFDFQTETPLPGRYQWVRTGEVNGHTTDEPKIERPCDGQNNKRRQSQSPRPDKRRAPAVEASGSPPGPCDSTTPLNEPETSEQQRPPLTLGNETSHCGIDCT